MCHCSADSCYTEVINHKLVTDAHMHGHVDHTWPQGLRTAIILPIQLWFHIHPTIVYTVHPFTYGTFCTADWVVAIFRVGLIIHCQCSEIRQRQQEGCRENSYKETKGLQLQQH